jgi:hypothetical protein
MLDNIFQKPVKEFDNIITLLEMAGKSSDIYEEAQQESFLEARARLQFQIDDGLQHVIEVVGMRGSSKGE